MRAPVSRRHLDALLPGDADRHAAAHQRHLDPAARVGTAHARRTPAPRPVQDVARAMVSQNARNGRCGGHGVGSSRWRRVWPRFGALGAGAGGGPHRGRDGLCGRIGDDAALRWTEEGDGTSWRRLEIALELFVCCIALICV